MFSNVRSNSLINSHGSYDDLMTILWGLYHIMALTNARTLKKRKKTCEKRTVKEGFCAKLKGNSLFCRGFFVFLRPKSQISIRVFPLSVCLCVSFSVSLSLSVTLSVFFCPSFGFAFPLLLSLLSHALNLNMRIEKSFLSSSFDKIPQA